MGTFKACLFRNQLHQLLNEIRELAEQKAVSHRDFYNVRKVRITLRFCEIRELIRDMGNER